jgi:hypothetical protein
MGRSYWFECAKCGYRAKVSGRVDRGINVFVQTIVCQDCKELYDAVTALRLPEQPEGNKRLASVQTAMKRPPSFQAALNRLTVTGARRFRWVRFGAQCPVASFHKVKAWTDPDKCPRCGLYLEKNTLPYRIWD